MSNLESALKEALVDKEVQKLTEITSNGESSVRSEVKVRKGQDSYLGPVLLYFSVPVL